MPFKISLAWRIFKTLISPILPPLRKVVAPARRSEKFDGAYQGGQFFKSKEEGKRILAKYSRINNESYLEAAYTASAKLYDAVPLVTRSGVETQIREAVARKPSAQLRFEDMVDDSIVRELEKRGFIDKVYKQ
jgi:hypothetical protein